MNDQILAPEIVRVSWARLVNRAIHNQAAATGMHYCNQRTTETRAALVKPRPQIALSAFGSQDCGEELMYKRGPGNLRP
jgi:hypothetical protein